MKNSGSPQLAGFCGRAQIVAPPQFCGPAQWQLDRHQSTRPDVNEFYNVSTPVRVCGVTKLPPQSRPSSAELRRRLGEDLETSSPQPSSTPRSPASPTGSPTRMGGPTHVVDFDKMLNRDSSSGRPALPKYKSRQLPPEVMVAAHTNLVRNYCGFCRLHGKMTKTD